ncbi:MAG: hypothetical protein HY590_05500 [Candidatus Omnitrophica bacterium]|nr:hypothetical protein [Candidatus Omnitrophota bacterium]
MSCFLVGSFLTYPYFWGKDLEEKKRFLDGELYAAAKVCERKIPATEALFFYNPIPAQKKHVMHTTPFFQEHDRQKLSYYLYPRRVYWEKQRVKEPIHYVLVYHTQLELPDFERLVTLSDTIYLLKKRGGK